MDFDELKIMEFMEKTRYLRKTITSIVLTLWIIVTIIVFVYRPLDHYQKDLENITSGTVCAKSISHGYRGLGDAAYFITVEPENSEEIQVPWFFGKKEIVRSFSVTESEYEALSIGDYYKQ